MIFGGICAGGKGTRLGNDTPKQFLMLKGKPVISYSVETMLRCGDMEKVIVAVGKDHTEYCKKLFPDEKVIIVEGGENRCDTVAILAEKARELGGGKEDILVTHDAARPFVTIDSIKRSAQAAKEYGAAGACIPASDTVFRSKDGFLSEAPPREEMFLAQTPQSFKLGLFFEVWSSLDESEKSTLTDACGMFFRKGVRVRITEGDRECFKITFREDLARAEEVEGL